MINPKKNINRLSWRFGEGKAFTPNQNDIDALNGLINYVNNEKQRELNNHYLFAKLFINEFKNDIIKSKGDYKLAISTLRSVLQIDLKEHYKAFNTEINQVWLEKQNASTIKDFTYPKWTAAESDQRLNEVLTNLIESYAY